MTKLRTLLVVPAVLMIAACPAPGSEEDSESAASPSDEDDEGQPAETDDSIDPEPSGTGTVPDPDPPQTTGDTEGETESDTCSFICEDDTPPIGDCDIWQQDCPSGEKCMPWANDGGTSWNSTICTPIGADPGQPGDPCVTEGGGVSGTDSCDQAAMCWDVDGETGEGVCVSMCQGSEGNPLCDDPTTSCVIANDGVLVLCLPACDPLLQDCSDGQACYVGDNAFVCVPDASGPDLGSFGDACEFTNACDPGLLCVSGGSVPGCLSGQCCSEFCDLNAPDPDASCTGVGDGQMCIGVFDEGEAPPGTEDFGFCAIPA